MKPPTTIERELEALRKDGNFRCLRETRPDGLYLWHEQRRYLNLSSNDYLGLGATFHAESSLTDLWQATFGKAEFSSFPHGNPASRLMTGNSPEYQLLENELASLFPGKEALVLSCGFMANSGLIPALTDGDDLILADKLSHASMIDGIRLSQAPFLRFRHNDTEHLERLLQKAKKPERATVMIESIYSMDGDVAPLHDIIALKRRYGFTLYVDEAHAFGVRGPQGRGYCAEAGLENEVDILLCTFGKALAGAGACVLCSPLLKEYLVNRMRPLIFSTALPPCTLQWDTLVLHAMRTDHPLSKEPRMSALRATLGENVRLFNQIVGSHAATHIIPLPAGSNERALSMVSRGMEQGYWFTAIRHPTVPKGAARIRLSLSAALSRQHITSLANLCKKLG